MCQLPCNSSSTYIFNYCQRTRNQLFKGNLAFRAALGVDVTNCSTNSPIGAACLFQNTNLFTHKLFKCIPPPIRY